MRLYELLRTSPFVVLDLSGTGALRGLDLGDLPATVVEGHPTRRPTALSDTTALVVRPDTYVAWATADVADVAAARTAIEHLLAPT